MSKRDVDKYYKQVCNDYLDAINTIKEFEEDMKKGLVAPERVERFKESFTPILDNYKQISYIMYLFNKPVKKKKERVYMSQNKQLLKIIGTDITDKKLLENKQALENMRKEI